MLQRLELPGRTGADVEPGPVAVGPRSYLLHVPIDAGDVAIQVVDRDLGPYPEAALSATQGQGSALIAACKRLL